MLNPIWIRHKFLLWQHWYVKYVSNCYENLKFKLNPTFLLSTNTSQKDIQAPREPSSPPGNSSNVKIWTVLRIRDKHPGSRIPDPNCSNSGSRIRIKEFKYFNQKIVPKLSEIWSGLLIPDPDPDFNPSWIQRSKRHRTPDPDPQHWIWRNILQVRVPHDVLY